MEDVDPPTEELAEEFSTKLTNQDYRGGLIAEAIFVIALDLQNNPEVDLQQNHPKLDSAINEVLDNEPEWVLRELQSNDLPNGFSQSIMHGSVKVVDLNDPILDHEWLMYPGNDFVEVLVRQYYPIICGENSLQSFAQATRSDKNVVRDGTILLISGVTAGQILIPLFALLTLHLIEENIDEVCEQYSRY
jgi:hypothetical protein